MPPIAEGALFVLVVAVIAAAVGLGFGRVIAPRIGRALDRADADDADEEPG